MITLEKIKDNKDPLKQGRVFTENGDWLHPVSVFSMGRMITVMYGFHPQVLLLWLSISSIMLE